jgi:drug/metabolite transporter (DMT)-like permease
MVGFPGNALDRENGVGTLDLRNLFHSALFISDRSMSLFVFAVVISAALLHASWNAIVKAGGDKLLSTIIVATAAAALSALLLPFLRMPALASWPFIIASVFFHIAYYLLTARTYQLADMSQAYPLMRGTAPLLVALVSVFLMGDALSPIAWIGIIGICLGIFSIAFGGNLEDRTGLYVALLNALVISGYTVIDGIGVRRSGAPATYTLWMFFLTGLPLTLWAITARGSTFVPYLRRYWRLGIAGGIGTTASYGLALWAMILAPIAVVAALRETSILFGTMIAGLVLKEPIGSRRVVAACIIAGGAAILRLA